jgi:hypothetical protein
LGKAVHRNYLEGGGSLLEIVAGKAATNLTLTRYLSVAVESPEAAGSISEHQQIHGDSEWREVDIVR